MKWQIDSAHSQILFSVKHMMLAKVRGSFDSFSGEIGFDPARPGDTVVKVDVDAASINTRNEQRDTHLRSEDFLAVDRHPQLSFQSTAIEVLDDERARLMGKLTIRDVTHDVELDVAHLGQGTSPWGTTVAGFSASTVLNRREWGLTWNKALETGGMLVGDEVKVQIAIEANKAKPPAPAVQ